MEVILKWFENSQKSNDGNDVISRTLMKIAVVSKHYRQKPGALIPKHGELWRCKIVKEISSGENKGAFLVEPLEQVHEKEIVHLIPGLYCSRLVKKRLIIYPKKMTGENGKRYNWILPLVHKHLMNEQNNVYCIIVQLDASAQDLADCEAQSHIVKE